MKLIIIATLATSLLALTACEDGKGDAKPEGAASAKTDKAGDDKPAGDTKEAQADEAEDAPDCEKVVDQIASLNEESGDAERKLWNKMCEEMTPAQRTCVASMKEMSGMKDCMGSKGDETLK